jgi:hypothetical protein
VGVAGQVGGKRFRESTWDGGGLDSKIFLGSCDYVWVS